MSQRQSYSEKLKDPRWQKRRLEVFLRDSWTCVRCGAADKPLHVHHKRYRGEPWEAPDAALETLCEDCHKGQHEPPPPAVPLRIYLAGRITGETWRETIVTGLDQFSPWPRPFWPQMNRSIQSVHHYVGPYREGHGWNAHGGQPDVKKLCLQAITSADFVFAWIDDYTAFGTIYEIGFLRGVDFKGAKRVVLGGSHRLPELWFLTEGEQTVIADSPADAFRQALELVQADAAFMATVSRRARTAA